MQNIVQFIQCASLLMLAHFSWAQELEKSDALPSVPTTSLFDRHSNYGAELSNLAFLDTMQNIRSVRIQGILLSSDNPNATLLDTSHVAQTTLFFHKNKCYQRITETNYSHDIFLRFTVMRDTAHSLPQSIMTIRHIEKTPSDTAPALHEIEPLHNDDTIVYRYTYNAHNKIIQEQVFSQNAARNHFENFAEMTKQWEYDDSLRVSKYIVPFGLDTTYYAYRDTFPIQTSRKIEQSTRFITRWHYQNNVPIADSTFTVSWLDFDDCKADFNACREESEPTLEKSYAYVYNPKRQLVKFIDNGSSHETITFAYNKRGKLSKSTRVLDTGDVNYSETTTYEYFPNGRLKKTIKKSESIKIARQQDKIEKQHFQHLKEVTYKYSPQGLPIQIISKIQSFKTEPSVFQYITTISYQ